jgi:hypothetical protein
MGHAGHQQEPILTINDYCVNPPLISPIYLHDLTEVPNRRASSCGPCEAFSSRVMRGVGYVFGDKSMGVYIYTYPKTLYMNILLLPRYFYIYNAQNLVEQLVSVGLETPKASFVSTGSIPNGIDKYNKKIMIVTIRDPDLFRVEN